MPSPADGLTDRTPPADGPALTLWAAMGILHEIQTQEKIALDRGDLMLLQRLLEEQAQAWEVVYLEAARLMAAGKAPPDMIRRLENILNIHPDRAGRLAEAQAEIQRRREQREGTHHAA